MTPEYERVATLISQVRNARFGEMVSYLEELINTGIWQDFTTPEGTHFEFRDGEFDYFLAAMEIDPEVVKRAYIYAKDVDGLADKQTRLADITGRGMPRERRERKAVAEIYGERVLRYEPVVTRRVASVAADPERRREYESTGKGRALPGEKMWRVRWSDQRSEAEVIAARLLQDPELAHEVYKILDAERVRTLRENKRRSKAESNGSVGRHNLSANQGDGSA
jgi:hypothetical protein